MSFYYLAGTSANYLTSASSITPSGAAHALFGTDNLHDGLPGVPFKFNVAASNDRITYDLGSAKSVDFCSIHGHNIDTGISAIQLRSSTDNFSGSDTLEATMTKATPTFYTRLSSPVSRRYWRTSFLGTNGNPISLGEVWLGLSASLTKIQRWEYRIEVVRPQIRQSTPSGQIFATNRTGDRQRKATMEFFGSSESHKDEIEEDLLEASGWGNEPLIIVPDSGDDIVIHGRSGDTWGYKRVATPASGGGYIYGLNVMEDPFEEEYL
jgi:hypothetical protein